MDDEERDPYMVALGAMWLALPITALRFWLAWDRLPLRVVTRWDDHWRPTGWGTRQDIVTWYFGILGVCLVLFTPACFVVRRTKPDQAWPVLVLLYLALALVWWFTDGLLSHNLSA